MINFYCNIWEWQSHILALLTKLGAEMSVSKGLIKKKHQWQWEKEHQDAFNEAKRMVIEGVKLPFLDFTKLFQLYLVASGHQLGATLVQEGKLLGFYTRKLKTT